MMRVRIAAFVTCAAFFLWIVPLGVFIRPSQEGKTCGGKRAFHMCHMGGAKAASTPAPAGPAVSAFAGFHALPDASDGGSSELWTTGLPDFFQPETAAFRAGPASGPYRFFRDIPGRPPNPAFFPHF